MEKIRGLINGGLYVAGVTVFFVGGVALSRSFDLELRVSPRTKGQVLATGYVPKYGPVSGTQLELVYVGSSTCGWSNQEELPEAVKRIKLLISENAAAHHLGFKATGVALDWQPELGVEHLAKYGPFDEISSGYNWGNTLALRDVWDPGEIHPQTPQLILYQRQLWMPTDSVGPERYVETGRHRMTTKIGLEAILEWAAAGAPFPDLKEETM